MVKVLLSDVDGTIVQEEGDKTPKAMAIARLGEIVDHTLCFLGQIDALGTEDLERARQRLFAYRENAIGDPRFYSRFCGSEQEALSVSPGIQSYIFFEAMKVDGKDLAGLVIPLMLASIQTGESEIIPYADALVGFANITQRGMRLATYSTPGSALQKAMLERVPIDVGEPGITNLAALVDDSRLGGGMHDKREFGDKNKSQSYDVAARYFAGCGTDLALYVTDGVSEAVACRQTGLDTVFVDRRNADVATTEKLQKSEIFVVKDLGTFLRWYTPENLL